MPSLRHPISWVLLHAQLWTPAFAQTLPIVADKQIRGQRPVVGVARNGVPVIHIAAPSAAGVSNNRFTIFNVGPSGVVLNNSGGSSRTQLAGAVPGNPMLGNGRAAIILNQVTGRDASLLHGLIEVAGNRAKVIVANPAGISCDGCGFVNAYRGTLTTGLPLMGPDGSLRGLDVAQGRLDITGKGLDGTGMSQVDLLARALVINASVWANRLNIVGGAGITDYATGAVTARPGVGDSPGVAIDMAALGGMYANGIRLVGTETGVGVNIGNHLVALTGDVHVSAAGDVRILPAAQVEAAGDVQLAAAKNLGTL